LRARAAVRLLDRQLTPRALGIGSNEPLVQLAPELPGRVVRYVQQLGGVRRAEPRDHQECRQYPIHASFLLRCAVAENEKARGRSLPGLRVTASGLRLADALARARAASPVVQSAAADVDVARGRLRQARLLPANPVLSADLARHTAPGGEDTKDRGVQLEQEIEVGGQRGLRVS